MEDLKRDLRYSFRLLARNPGFTVVALLTLTLGIGANSALFSLVNTFLLRPLNFDKPESLVMLWENNPQKGRTQNEVAAANYLDWKEQNQTFEQVAGLSIDSFLLTSTDEPVQVEGAFVSPNIFQLLRVEAAQGRTFLSDEDQPDRAAVAVLSHGCWQRRFGADPGIVNKEITLNGEKVTVVGVMPAEFQLPIRQFDIWLPLALSPEQTKNRGSHYLYVIGRLKPDATLKQAQSDISNISSRLEQEYPQTNSGWGASLISLRDQLVGDLKLLLLILLGAVGFVLLIACANVANLLLARASGRQKEIAVRIAMGASRKRLIRQLLTESMLISIIGGVLGLVLAVWGIKLLIASLPPAIINSVPLMREVNIDIRVLIFTTLISLFTGIIFGLAPALQASRPDLNETLKEGSRGVAGGVNRQRMGGALVVSEVALALILLICAGLFINSFVRLQQVDPGFNTENILAMDVALSPSRYDDEVKIGAFYKQLLEKIGNLPGVVSTGAVSHLPLGGSNAARGFVIQDNMPATPADVPNANYRMITPAYFTTLSIPLQQGRFFEEQDGNESPGVVIVNEALARRYFPNDNPIDKRVRLGGLQSKGPWLSIVGVVRNVKHFGLDIGAKPEMYLPLSQQPASNMTLVVHTGSNPENITAAARNEAQSLDREQPIYNVRTMKDVVRDSTSLQRLSTSLLGILSGVALALASVGIYGIISYTATQRTHEIGIRMALGAQRKDIFKLVVGRGLKLTIIGVITGLVLAAILAFLLTSFLEGVLFGVSATDPLTFGAIALLVILVAVVASYVPARRAMRVDPIQTLRYE